MKIFEHLAEVVKNYICSGNSKAVLQEYDARVEKAFILCIVTSLMCCCKIENLKSYNKPQ